MKAKAQKTTYAVLKKHANNVFDAQLFLQTTKQFINIGIVKKQDEIKISELGIVNELKPGEKADVYRDMLADMQDLSVTDAKALLEVIQQEFDIIVNNVVKKHGLPEDFEELVTE